MGATSAFTRSRNGVTHGVVKSGTRTVSRSFGRVTSVEATLLLADLIREVERPSVTVEHLLSSHISSLPVESSTKRDYVSSKNALIGGLGAKSAADLTRNDVQDLVSSWISSGRAVTTVRKRLRLLSAAYRDAIASGLVDHDPTEGVRVRRSSFKRPNATPTATPSAQSSSSRASWMWRRSVMPKTKTGPTCCHTSAPKAMQQTIKEAYYMTKSKTNDTTNDRDKLTGEYRHYQTIFQTNHDTVFARLIDHLRERAANGLHIGDAEAAAFLRGHDLVGVEGDTFKVNNNALPVFMREVASMPPDSWLVGPSSGKWRSKWHLSVSWRRFAESHGYVGTEGRRLTFHDLRHSYATALVASGADVKLVQSLMGHSSAAMTLDVYATCDPSRISAATSLVDGIFGNKLL